MTKLADWLFENSTTPGQLRRMLGVPTRSTINRLLTGQRRPGPELLAKIEALTKGEVSAADFEDPSPPRCARLVRRPDGSVRVVLPWSPDAEPEPAASDRLSPPLLRAIEVLDGRAWYTPKGRFLLDGRISDPKRIVAAANAVLRSQGKPPIPYPGVEPLL